MIPNYPRFKKITIRDKAVIDRFVSRYDPYSDFNFVSLYSWNTDKNTALSRLNGNLVIRLKDYTGDGVTYSILGETKLQESIQTLLTSLPRNGELKLIPHIVADRINRNDTPSDIILNEDRDNHDYVYELDAIVNLQGNDFKKKRNMIKTFRTKYPETVFEILDLGNKQHRKQIMDLVHEWVAAKDTSLNEDEVLGLQNVFALHKHIYGTGLFYQDRLIGFSIVEHLHNNFAMIHYEKTNHDYPGVTEHLMVETARHLRGNGITHLNFEQDLGVQNLRTNKLLWRPNRFLKKYRAHHQGSDR